MIANTWPRLNDRNVSPLPWSLPKVRADRCREVYLNCWVGGSWPTAWSSGCELVAGGHSHPLLLQGVICYGWVPKVDWVRWQGQDEGLTFYLAIPHLRYWGRLSRIERNWKFLKHTGFGNTVEASNTVYQGIWKIFTNEMALSSEPEFQTMKLSVTFPSLSGLNTRYVIKNNCSQSKMAAVACTRVAFGVLTLQTK